MQNSSKIGTEKEKDLITEQFKECYGNNLYSELDINYIDKDTLMEQDLVNYI